MQASRLHHGGSGNRSTVAFMLVGCDSPVYNAVFVGLVAEGSQTMGLTNNSAPLFDSFWLGGFEAACHINRARQRLDMLALTQHDRYVAEDYALLHSLGIRAARD